MRWPIRYNDGLCSCFATPVISSKSRLITATQVLLVSQISMENDAARPGGHGTIRIRLNTGSGKRDSFFAATLKHVGTLRGEELIIPGGAGTQHKHAQASRSFK
jgi:hypothetical protein